MTKGDDLAMVVNSGVDRNTCTIVDASGNRTIIPGSFPNSATNAPESGTSRVVASADRVIVLDSGNNENVTMYLPAGSANIPMQDSRRALSEQALTVFRQLVLASEGQDLLLPLSLTFVQYFCCQAQMNVRLPAKLALLSTNPDPK